MKVNNSGMCGFIEPKTMEEAVARKEEVLVKLKGVPPEDFVRRSHYLDQLKQLDIYFRRMPARDFDTTTPELVTYRGMSRLRMELKLQLRDARKNRKPEDVYKVKRLVALYGPPGGITFEEREVETTALEEELSERIAAIKLDMNSQSGAVGDQYAHIYGALDGGIGSRQEVKVDSDQRQMLDIDSLNELKMERIRNFNHTYGAMSSREAEEKGLTLTAHCRNLAITGAATPASKSLFNSGNSPSTEHVHEFPEPLRSKRYYSRIARDEPAFITGRTETLFSSKPKNDLMSRLIRRRLNK